MIAKLIVHGKDRASALGLLSAALMQVQVAGPATNVPFLVALSRHAAFVAGKFDTGLIAHELEQLVGRNVPPDEAWAAAALLAAGLHLGPESSDPFESLGTWSLWGNRGCFVILECLGERQTIRLEREARQWIAQVGKSRMGFELDTTHESQFRFTTTDRDFEFCAHVDASAVTLFMDGQTCVFAIPDALSVASEGGTGDGNIVAPMPGIIRIIHVKPGSKVAKGDALVVMEAMKMELTLPAPFDGSVAVVHVAEGDQIAEDTLLVSLGAGDATNG
jgi:3-methylcrotonyl-CoA carboxylase alpha subunit